MTNQEIIKCLRQCVTGAGCGNCNYAKFSTPETGCMDALMEDVLIVVEEMEERLKVK